MLKSQSRIYHEAGGWTKEASECGRKIYLFLKELMEEYDDTFSPDEIEALVISEIGVLAAQTRITDSCKRRKETK